MLSINSVLCSPDPPTEAAGDESHASGASRVSWADVDPLGMRRENLDRVGVTVTNDKFIRDFWLNRWKNVEMVGFRRDC